MTRIVGSYMMDEFSSHIFGGNVKFSLMYTTNKKSINVRTLVSIDTISIMSNANRFSISISVNKNKRLNIIFVKMFNVLF